MKLLLTAVCQATFGFLPLILALMISYSYGKEQTVHKNTHIFFPAVALCSFIALAYPSSGLPIWEPEWSFMVICTTLISCFLPTGVYHWTEGYRHLYTMGVAYNSNAFMQSMVPAAVMIGLCGLPGLVLSPAFDDVNIMNFGSYLFLKLLGQMGNGLFSILLYILLSHVLWFFGIHGTNMLEAISRRLFKPKVTANQAMAAQGLEPIHMSSKTFLDTFMFTGDNGCTLCMTLALSLAARKNNNRRLAKPSLPAVIFNINESALFGFPTILSTDMILPFILTPMVLSVISSSATWFSLVFVVSRSAEWTAPVLASGYLATGSVSGSLL